MSSFPPCCDGCSHKQQTYIPADTIHEATKVAAWGEMGGADEARLQRGFVGPSGRVLRKAARRAGLHVWSAWPNDTPTPRAAEEMAMFNAIRCRGSSNEYPGQEVALECQRRHALTTSFTAPASASASFATAVKPSVGTLLCGANAIEALTGYRMNPLSVRGSVLPLSDGGWGVGTIHPAYLVRGYTDAKDQGGELGQAMEDLEPLLAIDVMRAVKHCKPYVPRVYFTTPAKVLQAWNENPATLCAVDIEGSGGVPRILGLSWQRGTAWVMRWDDAARDLLRLIFRVAVTTFHNAVFDIPEVGEAGVPPPPKWVDTINCAALYNPAKDVKKNLQAQTLTMVLGSIMWKRLVCWDDTPENRRATEYARGMWREILRRLGRGIPQTDEEWEAFYNGLDTAYSLDLTFEFRDALTKQGRWQYYTEVMQPIQPMLITLTTQGMCVNPARLAHHRTACQRLMRMADGIVKGAAQACLQTMHDEAFAVVQALEMERALEKGQGAKKFSKADELSKARTKLRGRADNLEKGFNSKSPQQARALFYEFYGLPEVRSRKSKGPATDEEAIKSLLARLERKDDKGTPCPTIEPTRGTIPECARVLRAKLAKSIWQQWDSTFLNPEIDESAGVARIYTAYSQHRGAAGRFSSGVDDNDPDKLRKKRKVQQTQNIPKKLRDAFIPEPGYCIVGADWNAIQWALAMWFMGKLDDDGFHFNLLDKQQRGELDPHSYLASIVYSIPVEQIGKEDWRRQVCKGYTFGRLFDGSPGGLANHVGHPRSVGVKVCHGHDVGFRTQHWKEYTVKQAAARKYVQTPLGWRRYFWASPPKKEEVLATLIQATEADLMKWVAARIDVGLATRGWKWFASLHDYLGIQVPIPQRDEGKEWLRAQMEQPIPWLDGRGWKASVKAGMNWRAA